jgi:hypothetical protein
MDEPHLIAGAAGGDIEALFEKLSVAKRERASFGGIDHRKKDNISFVALELGGISAKDPVLFVDVRCEMVSEETLYLDGLLLAK